MGKSDAPLSFADLIEEAQKTPESTRRAGKEVSSPFGMPLPADHAVIDGDDIDEAKIPGVAEYDYDAKVCYFALPKDIPEYEAVLNQVLKAEAILRYEDRSFTKEGDCIIVMCYLAKTPRAQALVSARRRRQRRADPDAD